MNTIAMEDSQINYTNWQIFNLYMIKLKGMPNFYNVILTLFQFSVKFNYNSDLTLFHLKVSDTGDGASDGGGIIGIPGIWTAYLQVIPPMTMTAILMHKTRQIKLMTMILNRSNSYP